MRLVFKKIISNYLIFTLALASVFFIQRSSLPNSLYYFFVIQFVNILFLIKKYNLSYIIKKNIESFRYFSPYYLLILAFIASLIIGGNIKIMQKDLLNILIIISFILIFPVVIDSKDRLKIFFHYFYLSFVVILLSYLSYRLILGVFDNNIVRDFLLVSQQFDYNMFSLNLFIGIGSVIYLLNKSKGKLVILLLNIILIIFTVLIIFSGSRRAIFILFFLLIIFIIFQVYSLLKKRDILLKYSGISFVLLSLIIFGLFFITTTTYNRRFVIDTVSNGNLGVKNSLLYSPYNFYRKFIDKTISLTEFKNKFYGIETNDKNDIKDCKELLKFSEDYFKSKNYTKAVIYAQKAVEYAKSKTEYFSFLPVEFRSVLPEQNYKYIAFLPELLKKPYVYENFFSCVYINGFNLEDYYNNSNYPFEFSYSKPLPIINFNLPCLSDSRYILKFDVIANTDIIDSIYFNNKDVLVNKKNSRTKFGNKYKYSYEYSISSKNNIKDYANLTIVFIKNKYLRFSMSDIKWELIETKNNESSDIIFKNLHDNLKQFKKEQNRSNYLWQQYLNTSIYINNSRYIKRDKKAIKKTINTIIQNRIVVNKYYKSKIKKFNKGKEIILFDSLDPFPRAYFKFPAIQNSNITLEINYTYNGNEKVVFYTKRYPEMINVYYKYSTLKDTLIQKGNTFKKILKYRIDSINSSTVLLIMGVKNGDNKQDSIVINRTKYSINIGDSGVYLSDAQYNYLKSWANRNKGVVNNNRIEKEENKLKQNNLWKIDSSVYSYSGYDRLELIAFGWNYYKSLPLVNKIFGDGFKYLDVYKARFIYKYGKNLTYSPHNPLLEALLYSGIIGLFIYLYFIILQFISIFQNFKEFKILGILFILIFIFSFVSGTSVFSIPAFVLFSVFPFLFKYYKKI